jgi:hypothetical protein
LVLHNKTYIAVSEFIEEGYHQQRQLQRKFTLLASRLNLKLAALEQRINEKGVKKEICKESMQSQENELTKNYTQLQHDFEILYEKYTLLMITLFNEFRNCNILFIVSSTGLL